MVKQCFIKYYWHSARRKIGSVQNGSWNFLSWGPSASRTSLDLAVALLEHTAYTSTCNSVWARGLLRGRWLRQPPPFPRCWRPQFSFHSSAEWSPCCPGCSRIWSSGQTQSSWENTPLDTQLSQPVPVSFKFYGKLGLHRVPLIFVCNLVMARC